MKTLVLGAGPLGCLYTHRLVHKGNDVTLLARMLEDTLQRFEPPVKTHRT